MHGFRLILLALGVAWFSDPAHALPVVTSIDGLNYRLEMQTTANPLIANFAFVITGENSVTDTVGGRTGIHAFALTDPAPGGATSGFVAATLYNNVVTAGTNGFVFHTGGLASGGCNDTGNFFCFESAASPPGVALSGPMVIAFQVTRSSGDWATFAASAPHLKVDWTGSANNYDLFSQEVVIQTTCPNCTPTPFDVDPVAEPASMALLGAGLIGLGWARKRFGSRFA